MYKNSKGTLFNITEVDGAYVLRKKLPGDDEWEPVTGVRSCWLNRAQAVRDLAYIAETFGLEKVDE